MNRIHVVSQHSDDIFSPDHVPVETYPPLHLCPVSGAIVPCGADCKDCAHLDEYYQAKFHADRAGALFGSQLRDDAGECARGFVLWLLDVTEHWPPELFWALILLAICGFWVMVWFLWTYLGGFLGS